LNPKLDVILTKKPNPKLDIISTKNPNLEPDVNMSTKESKHKTKCYYINKKSKPRTGC
jgi:hypothetical protein